MEELDPLFAEVIYDENGELNDYARSMQAEFPEVEPKVFAHLRYAKEYEASALLGKMDSHFGAFEFSRMETAVEKHMALAADGSNPVPLQQAANEEEAAAVFATSQNLEQMQRESNTERFASKAADVAAAIPSQLLGATMDFGKDVLTQPVRTAVGSVENAERMASGVYNTGKDAPDVVDYAFKRLDMGVGNMISRGVGLVGNEGDARSKGWNRIFAVQRAIDAIPGPALGFAATGVRLPIQSEADLEFYKSLGINTRNAKVGGYMDRSVNITKLDQIAERFGTTATEMTITGGESAVAKSLNEVDTALGAFIGDASALAAMTVATGGGNLLVRMAKDGAIEAGSYTDSDPGFTEAVLHMTGFDEDEIPELLKTSGKQDAGAMAVRFVEGAAFSLAAESMMGFFGKLKKGEIESQEVLKATVEESHVLVKEALSEMEETAQALAKEADAHVNAAKAIEAEEATPTTGPAAANPDVEVPEFPKNLSGAKPKYRNMHLEFDNETAKALYIVGGNGKSAHHDAFMDFLNKTLGTETDWAAVGTRMRDTMKENYVEGGTFKVELPYEARFDVAKSAMAKDAQNNAPTPKSIEISSNMEGIVEDLAVGKHLDDLDDKAIDAATGVRDFRNYPFLETVGKTTDAIKRNLESALDKQPTTVKAIIGKADAALQQLRKEFGDGHLPAWALEKIDTGSQAADVLARVISIKTTNDQIVRLTEYINVLNKGTNPDAALKNLGGLQFISKAENPREMATWYLTKLLEGAEDLNGAYNKIARDWGQTGVILNKLKRGIKDADTQANLEQIVKREMEAGYLTPEEAVKRMEDYKLANANNLNKFGGVQKHGLMEFLENNQYASLLLNVPTMMVNLTSEVRRTVGYATTAPIANSIALFRQGQVGKAGIEAGRLFGLAVLAPKQIGKVIRNVHDVWATGMGNMTRELTPYIKSDAAMTLGDVFNAQKNLPLSLANVSAAVVVRTMGTISESIGTIFHGANTDYSVLVGQYGKKWQQRYLKQGGLSVEDITEMLTETLPKSQQRKTVSGQVIDGQLAEASAAARFQDNVQGTAVGALENAYNKGATKSKWMRWAIPFFGVGVRIAEETATMAIPGLAFLNKGNVSTVAAKRMGLGQFGGPVVTSSQRAWRYFYGAAQVNMMTSMLQGLNDYSELVDGMPEFPKEIGEKTEHFKPVSGKFGQFGGGVVEYEMTPEGVRRVEEKSFEMMNSDTISFLWRNLGWHLALIGDDTDATEAGEAMSRMLQSQINSVFGASVARTLPAEFSRVTGAEGGKGYFDWVLGKVGAQVVLGSGYRNMKKLYKEYFGNPETYKATFEDGWGAYSAGRLSWLGDFAAVAWPGQFRAMNLNLGFAGYPVDASKRGNIDPNKKVATLPKSVIVANWVAEQQDRKLVQEEWTVPGSPVLLRDVMGPSGFSLFTETMKASQTVELPHPISGEMMTLTDYMDYELDNPQSQLRLDLAKRGLVGDEIAKIADGDKVAALEAGEVLWEFIKASQKRYNDMALADIINNAPKATREAILLEIEMKSPEFWYEQFPPEVKAQLNLIDKGEATYSDGEFRLFKEGQ